MAKQVALRRAQAQDEAIENSLAVEPEDVHTATTTQPTFNPSQPWKPVDVGAAPGLLGCRPLYLSSSYSAAGVAENHSRHVQAKEALRTLMGFLHLPNDSHLLTYLYALLKESDFSANAAYMKIIEARLAVQSMALQESMVTASRATPGSYWSQQVTSTLASTTEIMCSMLAPNPYHMRECLPNGRHSSLRALGDVGRPHPKGNDVEDSKGSYPTLRDRLQGYAKQEDVFLDVENGDDVDDAPGRGPSPPGPGTYCGDLSSLRCGCFSKG